MKQNDCARTRFIKDWSGLTKEELVEQLWWSSKALKHLIADNEILLRVANGQISLKDAASDLSDLFWNGSQV